MALATSVLTGLMLLPTLPPGRPTAQETIVQEIQFHRVHLKNGNYIDGRLLRQTATEVALEVKIGEIVLRHDLIERIEVVRIRHISSPKEELPRPPSPPEPVRVPRPAPPEPKPVQPPAAPPPGEGVPDEQRKKFETLLSLSELATSEDDRQALAARLAALGSEYVPCLNAFLSPAVGRSSFDIVCRALGILKDRRSIAPLSAGLRDPDPFRREICARTLGELGFEDGAAPLIQALDDESPKVTRTASTALVNLSRSTSPFAIIALLGRRISDAKNQGIFASTLGKIGGPEARRLLLDLLREETLVLPALEGLISCADPEDGHALLDVLNRGPDEVRESAARLLGRIKYKPAVPALIELLHTPNAGLKSKAHEALRAISGEDLAPDPDAWRNWWDTAGNREP